MAVMLPVRAAKWPVAKLAAEQQVAGPPAKNRVYSVAALLERQRELVLEPAERPFAKQSRFAQRPYRCGEPGRRRIP